MGVNPKIVVPQNGWFLREDPIRIVDLVYTLPETNMFAPENRPKRHKRKGSYSNHPFSRAKMLVSGRVSHSY